jgi:Zn-dependent protease with chaperone function
MTAGEIHPANWEFPDRLTFFEEQRRNRRTARRAAVWCGIVMICMGLALSAAIMPIIFVLILNYVHASSAQLGSFNSALRHVIRGFEGNPPDRVSVLWLFAAWLLPGLVAVLLLWLFIRRIHSSGAGDLAQRIPGARAPDIDNLKERQLLNVIAELAIAAGIEVPKLLLLDDAPANAGISGRSPHDSTIIISKEMLEQFNRDQLQGALAILISSIANGDLYVLYNTLSLFEAFGAVLVVITSPFSSTSRLTCWSLLKLGLMGKGDPILISEQLLQRGSISGMQEMNSFMTRRLSGKGISTWVGSLIIFALLPFFLVAIFSYMIVTLVPLFLAGPLLAAEWRHRRHLSDSTAVQLTRSPDHVAQALIALTEYGGVVGGQLWADLLFIVGAEVWKERNRKEYAEIAKEVQQRLTGKSRRERAEERLRIAAEFTAAARARGMRSRSARENGFGAKLGLVGSFRPSINKRLLRLRAMGATVDWPVRREFPAWIIVLLFIFFVSCILMLALLEALKNAR